MGNKIYEKTGSEADVLKQMLIDGGYYDAVKKKYYYYLTDHLGNNRVVVDANGTIDQYTHYYPFGMAFVDSKGENEQRFKYNGKELDRTMQLNTYDYAARYMDPAIGRFTSMDPLAESSYNWSPYVYVENNPLRWTDPSGMEKGDPNDPYDLPEVTVTGIDMSPPFTDFGLIMNFLFSMTSPAPFSTIGSSGAYLYVSNPAFRSDVRVAAEFMTGRGPESRSFGEDHPSSRSLRRSHLTKLALNRIRRSINEGKYEGVISQGFNPLESGDKQTPVSGPVSAAMYAKGYSTDQMVGSANYHYKVVGNEIKITVTNEHSIYSLFLHIPPDDMRPSRSETPGGMYGKTYQSFTFSVPLHEIK